MVSIHTSFIKELSFCDLLENILKCLFKIKSELEVHVLCPGHRSSSVSCNADQKNRLALRLSARRTPPITGGRLNPTASSKDSGPAYHHLQEAEGSERDIEPARV